MKASLIILFLIISIHAKLQINACNYESSKTENPSYDDCKVVSTGDDEQCCVAVLSFYGNNQYFCETFNKRATQEEINNKMNTNYKEIFEKEFPGLEVKVGASCSGDIPPFKFEKCSIEDTQRIEPFENCKDFKKEKEDDYCCLFSGKVKDNEVMFCTELNEDQVIQINETTTIIDRSSNMYDIQYMNCSPSYIPNNKQFYLSYNLLILGLLLLISF